MTIQQDPRHTPIYEHALLTFRAIAGVEQANRKTDAPENQQEPASRTAWNQMLKAIRRAAVDAGLEPIPETMLQRPNSDSILETMMFQLTAQVEEETKINTTGEPPLDIQEALQHAPALTDTISREMQQHTLSSRLSDSIYDEEEDIAYDVIARMPRDQFQALTEAFGQAMRQQQPQA